MGVQKNRWRKNYSSTKHPRTDKYQLHQRVFLQRRLLNTQTGSKTTGYSIAEEMYRVACECDFVSDRYRKLVDSLLQKLS